MRSTQSKISDLREVETSYDIDRINEASKLGSICLFRKREENPDLRFRGLILHNRVERKFVTVHARTVYLQYGRAPLVYNEYEWVTIQEFEGYARIPKTECNWGAYILPGDATVGEDFRISELIEDLLATEFWYSKVAAETAIATWNGQDLIIDHSSYRNELIG